jgi:hypothetical protein
MPAPLRTLLGICCFVIMTLGADATALAQQAEAPFRLALSYTTSADECPNDQQLRATVQAELGRDPFDSHAAEQVTVVIRSQGSKLIAEITLPRRLREAARVRVLVSPRGDCRELVRALTLALCLLIDPLHVENAGHSEVSPTAQSAQPAASPASSIGGRKDEVARKALESAEDSAMPDARQASRRDALRAYVQLGGLLSTGLAPGIGFGAALELGVRRAGLSLGVEGRFDLSRQTAFQNGTVHVSARMLSLAPCWLPARLVACGLLSGGEIVASGSGFPVSHRGRAPLIAAGARIGFEAPLHRHLAVRVFAEAQALLNHAEVIANRSVAWEAGPLFADAGVSGIALF